MGRAGLLLLALALLAACATPGAAAPAGPDVSGDWELREGTVAGAPLPMPTAATLAVTRDRVSGTAFCNSYDAGYTRDGDGFTVGDLAITEMGCEPDVMAAEQSYVAALIAVDTVEVTGDQLVLTGPDVALTFTRQVPEPDRELVGTRWVLDTLVDGEVASSVQGEPLLQLRADGSASSTTGCNGTAGTWRLEGDVLTVDPGASTLGGCDPPLQAQERHVHEVLTVGATVAIDGDRLTLTAADGRGLGYRAG